VLGRGGFAAVAEGRDLRQNGARCAIKIFRQEFANRDWVERRFDHEVRALRQIHHPNVVRIYESGILPSGTMYLTMEFIAGSTLRELLNKGKLPPPCVALYLRQMGCALDAIHAHGICHRDLKPENLMLRASAPHGQELVLIDFSIAIVKAPDHTIHGISRVAGTLGYMAPEQVTGYADASTDIHSLAKLLLELMTGLPCAQLMPQATLDLPRHVREYFSAEPGGLTKESIDQIAAALAFDPSQRPKDVTRFAATIIRDLSSN
jgi:eukaryotic-like serine/threonine-protein kinase